MAVFTVVNIGNTLEATCKGLLHLCFADETLPPGFRSSWKIKGAIIGEECHNSIEIMPIECFKNLL